MKYLCVPEKYEADGTEQVRWNRIGEMFEAKNGKTYAKLYHMPNVLVHVFEKQEKKEDVEF